MIGGYLSGQVLPPTDRFDALVRLLGATPAEQGALATARDRVADARRQTPKATHVVPRQLPLDGAGFTGREPQLAQLDALPHRDPTSGTVVLLVGTAGVGKTALAVRWAHRSAARFPDGQLHVDLRGYDPRRPVAAADALGGFLRALGVDGADVPRGVAERAALYRSLVAGRRLLVLLDNASGADQVRPLLPGAASCLALVTSRDDLAGLVVREGAHRVRLDPLSAADAARLLRALLRDRVDAEPAAAAALARRCAGLPLALRIAAEFAAGHDGLRLRDVVADLDGAGTALDRLDIGDPRSAVRAVFSWSHRHLAPPARRLFALLGLHPGADLDGPAVAALAGVAAVAAVAGVAGVAAEPARAALTELVRAHLVARVGADRYGMHDLLRAYAAESARNTLSRDERRAALVRLLDHHVAAATAAAAALYPHDQPGARPAPGGAGTARRALDRERGNLVALAGHAARHGLAAHAAGLSEALWRYFEVGGHAQEALAVHGAAARAATHELPPERVARVLANLGGTHWWLGEHARARRWFEQSLAWHERGADRAGRARALARLGLAHERLGDYPRARACLVGALAGYRGIGDRHGEGSQLLNLGGLHRRLGRYALARRHLRRAAALFAELGDARLEGYALGNLGALESLVGRHEEALDQLRRALAACRSCQDRGGEGSALAALGAAQLRLGRPAEALARFGQALAISRETGEAGLRIEALNGLGATLAAIGRPDAAVDRYRAALDLARRAGDPHEAARALAGLADLGAPAPDVPLPASPAGLTRTTPPRHTAEPADRVHADVTQIR
ncbi:tetratricopeptide repeat protein [Dactylosporangium sp. AC04546]|uniref:ATP-binding protein n=1 Tax=Dactylosporangium sp. AC04546 TaxID=2862460 RepID=UPI001EDCA887|nr:tetratricopeptide repeat protein [Dactylosporangium sp. AC04546]WVK87304.1 tetratricopeptide repeat protein [Dactylosporangium sp. AC04546]